MFLFCEAKAKTARQGREIFPSGKIFPTESLPLRQFTILSFWKDIASRQSRSAGAGKQKFTQAPKFVKMRCLGEKSFFSLLFLLK